MRTFAPFVLKRGPTLLACVDSLALVKEFSIELMRILPQF